MERLVEFAEVVKDSGKGESEEVRRISSFHILSRVTLTGERVGGMKSRLLIFRSLFERRKAAGSASASTRSSLIQAKKRVGNLGFGEQ